MVGGEGSEESGRPVALLIGGSQHDGAAAHFGRLWRYQFGVATTPRRAGSKNQLSLASPSPTCASGSRAGDGTG